MSTKELLNATGFTNVLSASSAPQALSILGSGSPATFNDVDCILMDVSMPEMSGIDACLQIKANDHLKDIPIIMVTARTEEEVLEKAFSAGAMDYVTKPANPIELVMRLRSALTLKRELDCRKMREHELAEVTRQLEEKNRILEHLATSDPVTGLASRRSFDSALIREWQRTIRQGDALSIIMIDSDNFKAYNDTYGHLQGDECLRRIGQVLSDSAKRPGDVVARYGGEEFVIILPNTNLEGAEVIAQKLIRRIEDLQIPHTGTPAGYVTVSCGIATTIPDLKKSAGALLMAADQALYQAKSNGKNQFVAIMA